MSISYLNLGRVFRVEMPMKSCELNNFLRPNLYNWSSSLTPLQRLDSSQHNFNMLDNKAFYKKVNNTRDFSTLFGTTEIAYFKSNYDFIGNFKNAASTNAKLHWMEDKTMDLVNAMIFNSLFRLQPSIQNKLHDFVTSKIPPGYRLVCAHVRMGRNPSFPSDTEIKQAIHDLPIVWDFLRNQTQLLGKTKLFFMSDSDEVVKMARGQDFGGDILVSPGPVVHVDKNARSTDEQKCRGFEKVIVDQQILVKYCDVLLISKSGLSRMAAYFRQTDRGLYCLMGNSIVKCQTESLRSLYNVYG